MKYLGNGGKSRKTQKKNRKATKKMKKRSSKKTRKTRKQDETLMCKVEMKKEHGLYSEKEFNSGDGMLTTVWGPSLWHTLHTISFNYPVNPTTEDKKRYQKFVCNLRYVLPCKYCRINLRKNFKSLPPTMEVMKSRETFSKYIYDLHELVNKMLNKKSNLSYCDVKTRYEHFRARCTDDKNKIWKIGKIKKTIKNHKKREKEKGCTTPLYSGEKSKCIIKIVPQSVSGSSFQMDKKCEKKFIGEVEN
jgi:hypothetical protein